LCDQAESTVGEDWSEMTVDREFVYVSVEHPLLAATEIRPTFPVDSTF
jgi:hypothetical protein